MPARLFHVNVNCTDLDRALGFYRDTLGLRPLARTTPTRPQPGDAFGLAQAQWDAWILTGEDGLDGVALDLLAWHVPPPRRARAPGGFDRLRLRARSGAAHATTDPDGTTIELLPGPAPRLAGLVVGCVDVAASAAFYTDVVGLARLDATQLCDDRGPEGFVIELVAATRPVPPRVANDVGIYRVALITDAFERDHQALLDAGVRPYSAPATLDMGPGLPRLRAVFFPDPDGSTLELIEQPVVTPSG